MQISSDTRGPQQTPASAPQPPSAFQYPYFGPAHAPVCLSPPVPGKPDEHMHASHAYSSNAGVPQLPVSPPLNILAAPQRSAATAMHMQRCGSAPMEAQLVQHSGLAVAPDATLPHAQHTQHGAPAAAPFPAVTSAADVQSLVQLTQCAPSSLTPMSDPGGAPIATGSDPHDVSVDRLRPWSISAPQLPYGFCAPESGAAPCPSAPAVAPVPVPISESHPSALPLQLLLQQPPAAATGAAAAPTPWHPPPRSITPAPHMHADAYGTTPAAPNTGAHAGTIPYALVPPLASSPIPNDGGMGMCAVRANVAPVAIPPAAQPLQPAAGQQAPPQLHVAAPGSSGSNSVAVTVSMHEAAQSSGRSPSCPAIPIAPLTVAHPPSQAPPSLYAPAPYTVSTGDTRLPQGHMAPPHMHAMHAATVSADSRPMPQVRVVPLQPQHDHRSNTGGQPDLARSVSGTHAVHGPSGWGMHGGAQHNPQPSNRGFVRPPQILPYPVSTPKTLHAAPHNKRADTREATNGPRPSWAPVQGALQGSAGPGAPQQPPFGYTLAPLGYDPNVLQGWFGAMTTLPGVISTGGLDGAISTPPPATAATPQQGVNHAAEAAPPAAPPSAPSAAPAHTPPWVHTPSQPPVQAAPSTQGAHQGPQAPPATGPAVDMASGSALGMLAVSTNLDLLQLQQPPRWGVQGNTSAASPQTVRSPHLCLLHLHPRTPAAVYYHLLPLVLHRSNGSATRAAGSQSPPHHAGAACECCGRQCDTCMREVHDLGLLRLIGDTSCVQAVGSGDILMHQVQKRR